MTGEKLKEFLRRLTAGGYEPDLDENGAGKVRDGERSVTVLEDGEIRYKPESRELARRVCAIRNEVDEYMTAFKNSPYGNGEYSGRLTNIETRTLMKHAGCEFAMRWNRGGCADFVTWRLDRNGEREIGHYFDDYAEAKEDFAVRAGLLDRSKLFTETELAVLRSSLSDYLSLDGNSLTYGNEETVRGVIGKIDAVIAPEIEEQANEAEDQGYEPEMDL